MFPYYRDEMQAMGRLTRSGTTDVPTVRFEYGKRADPEDAEFLGHGGLLDSMPGETAAGTHQPVDAYRFKDLPGNEAGTIHRQFFSPDQDRTSDVFKIKGVAAVETKAVPFKFKGIAAVETKAAPADVKEKKPFILDGVTHLLCGQVLDRSKLYFSNSLRLPGHAFEIKPDMVQFVIVHEFHNEYFASFLPSQKVKSPEPLRFLLLDKAAAKKMVEKLRDLKIGVVDQL